MHRHNAERGEDTHWATQCWALKLNMQNEISFLWFPPLFSWSKIKIIVDEENVPFFVSLQPLLSMCWFLCWKNVNFPFYALIKHNLNIVEEIIIIEKNGKHMLDQADITRTTFSSLSLLRKTKLLVISIFTRKKHNCLYDSKSLEGKKILWWKCSWKDRRIDDKTRCFNKNPNHASTVIYRSI